MKKFKTHVCMVSGQPAPNLLPLLDEALKPEKVILLATPQMSKKADDLRAVIQPLGIKVEINTLDAADNFDAIQEKLLILLSAEQNTNIALNVTGGTKWMAIAAQEVFRAHGFSVFYVNIAQDTVLFLGEKQEPHKLQERINLDNFLKANGYTITEGSKPQGLIARQRELCERLVLNVNEWQAALGQLNLLASLAEQKKSLRISFADSGLQPDQYLQVLLSELSDANVLRSSDKIAITFADESSRFFSNGGWLEYYVNSLLNQLKSEHIIQDSARLNLKIRSAMGSENELDVAFMANNHLHIIECKTKRFTGARAGLAGTDALYKLDSISDLGGFGTKSMLVSYRQLQDADRQRAKDLRIKVIEGAAIQQLKTHLKRWLTREVIFTA